MKPGRETGVGAGSAFVGQGKDFRVILRATRSLWKAFGTGVTGSGFLFKGVCVVISVTSMLCVFKP